MEKNISVNLSEKLLRVEDVAQRLNISKSLAYQLMRTGEFPTIRFKRTVRVLEEDLQEFILRCRLRNDSNNSTYGNS